MSSILSFGDIAVGVTFKDIKNVHLSVYPPFGSVRVTAPRRMRLDLIRLFVISKLVWIKEQQRKLCEQERETPRDYVDRESHFVWGTRYLLEIRNASRRSNVELRHRRMLLFVTPGTSHERREAIVEAWYREQLKAAVPPLLARWQSLMRVEAERFHVQRMKTKWGSANRAARSIRLNTELAKKPPECLEYLVVHELAHLIEPTHNARFVALMDRFLPQWRMRRDHLNRLPVRRENWKY